MAMQQQWGRGIGSLALVSLLMVSPGLAGVTNLATSTVSFQPNQGQAPAGVRFVARGPDYAVLLSPDGATFAMAHRQQRHSVRMTWEGDVGTPQLTAAAPLPGRIHYIGRERSLDMARYGQVRYDQIYPGIDVIFYARERKPAYDFIVQPGADPDAITLGFQDMDELRVGPQGGLLLEVGNTTIRQQPPIIYQGEGADRTVIEGRYVRKGPDQLGFQVADYDPERPLVIDPAVTFASRYGGSAGDRVRATAVDSEGNLYIAGSTFSLDLPLESALQPDYGGNAFDAFVAKIDPEGPRLVYATYLGGSGDDQGRTVAVDEQGRAHVAGTTWSTDFPVRNAFQDSLAGDNDVFLVRLSAAGNEADFATYLGGSGLDQAAGLALGASGQAYLSGTTLSGDFPVRDSLQDSSASPGQETAFVAKLDMAQGTLGYATYLGGSRGDEATTVAVDNQGRAVVGGYTFSADFPTRDPLQGYQHSESLPGRDGFLAKLNAAGDGLVFSTFLGGDGPDTIQALGLDADGGIVATGETTSRADFPVQAGHQEAYGGGISDAFVAALAADGQSLRYATFLGADGEDRGLAVAVRANGGAAVAGRTGSSGLATIQALQRQLAGDQDGFWAQLDSQGVVTEFSYWGGSGRDVVEGAALNGDALYLAGTTQSQDLPSVNPLQTPAGERDGFIVKVDGSAASVDLRVTQSAAPTPVPQGTPLFYTIDVTNHGPDEASGVIMDLTPPAGVDIQTLSSSQGNCSTSALRCEWGTLAAGASATVTLAVPVTGTDPLNNAARVSAQEPEINPDDNQTSLTTEVQVPAATAVNGNDGGGGDGLFGVGALGPGVWLLLPWLRRRLSGGNDARR